MIAREPPGWSLGIGCPPGDGDAEVHFFSPPAAVSSYLPRPATLLPSDPFSVSSNPIFQTGFFPFIATPSFRFWTQFDPAW